MLLTWYSHTTRPDSIYIKFQNKNARKIMLNGKSHIQSCVKLESWPGLPQWGPAASHMWKQRVGSDLGFGRDPLWGSSASGALSCWMAGRAWPPGWLVSARSPGPWLLLVLQGSTGMIGQCMRPLSSNSLASPRVPASYSSHPRRHIFILQMVGAVFLYRCIHF